MASNIKNSMLDIILIYPHQLFDFSYFKKLIDIKTKILLLEHDYFFTRYKFHKLKLVLHIASMKYYCDNNDDIILTKNLKKFLKENNPRKIKLYNPVENDLLDEINKLAKIYDIEIYDTPYFLNSIDDNIEIKNKMKSIRHDLFYKNQRIKYDLLIDNNDNNSEKPLFGKWSFDELNRNKFPANITEPIEYKINTDKYTKYAIKYVEKHYKDNYGEIKHFIYPISRKSSLLWLKQFIKHKLLDFGEYEDAMSDKIKFGYHSLLSPILNIGLITPHDIIKLIKKIKITKKNVASIEGFVRQIIGWREYNYFIYYFFRDYLETNHFYTNNKRNLPDNIWNRNTNIIYIDDILNKVHNYAYSHHIERLMGIGNFLNLIGVKPEEIYKWFSTMYIDAYDVFMIPNVYGMLLYGYVSNNKHMMTKPYLCSSNYIIKMSNYKKDEWNEIINALYYEFINLYKAKFKKIYSLAMMVKNYENKDSNELKQMKQIKNKYLTSLY